MKTTTLWIIRVALLVQFLGVLAVPSLLAANEAPRGMWMADWHRPQITERTIGVLRIRDGKLSFVEQLGQVDWELELTSVKSVSITNNGHSLTVMSVTGDQYVVSVMEANLTETSPKKVATMIERAMQSVAANNR